MCFVGVAVVTLHDSQVPPDTNPAGAPAHRSTGPYPGPVFVLCVFCLLYVMFLHTTHTTHTTQITHSHSHTPSHHSHNTHTPSQNHAPPPAPFQADQISSAASISASASSISSVFGAGRGLAGDCMAVAGAVGYGLYTTAMRLKVSRPYVDPI